MVVVVITTMMAATKIVMICSLLTTQYILILTLFSLSPPPEAYSLQLEARYISINSVRVTWQVSRSNISVNDFTAEDATLGVSPRETAMSPRETVMVKVRLATESCEDPDDREVVAIAAQVTLTSPPPPYSHCRLGNSNPLHPSAGVSL